MIVLFSSKAGHNLTKVSGGITRSDAKACEPSVRRLWLSKHFPRVGRSGFILVFHPVGGLVGKAAVDMKLMC